jgi:TolA-binding protein
VIALLVAAAVASQQDAFYAAAALEGSGQAARAAAAFEQLAHDHPDDDLADDALLEAARMHEERLGDPTGALRLYDELVTRYPASRLARRAAGRVDFLRANIGDDPTALRDYQDIIANYPLRAHDDSCARMQKLLLLHPAFPLAAQATFWLGQARQQDQHFDDALAAYDEILRRWPRTEWAPRAEKAIGDVWLTRGSFARARRAYDVLGARGGSSAEVAEYGRQAVHAAELRWGIWWLCTVVLAGFVVGYGSVIVRRRTRPAVPLELKYYLPVGGMFVAAGATEHIAVFRATTIIALGGAVVTFLLGQRPPGRRLWHGLAAALAVAAVFVLAVESQHLGDMVIETWKTGVER